MSTRAARSCLASLTAPRDQRDVGEAGLGPLGAARRRQRRHVRERHDPRPGEARGVFGAFCPFRTDAGAAAEGAAAMRAVGVRQAPSRRGNCDAGRASPGARVLMGADLEAAGSTGAGTRDAVSASTKCPLRPSGDPGGAVWHISSSVPRTPGGAGATERDAQP